VLPRGPVSLRRERRLSFTVELTRGSEREVVDTIRYFDVPLGRVIAAAKVLVHTPRRSVPPHPTAFSCSMSLAARWQVMQTPERPQQAGSKARGLTMTISERLGVWFVQNPIAWFLLVAFLLSAWGGYKNGRDLDRVCALTQDAPALKSAAGSEEVAVICLGRRPAKFD
jgi:hypothetical protein